MMKTILFVGGTGAQGSAVVRVLAATGQYRILLFTRDVNSSHCTQLTRLPGVEAIANPAKVGYDLTAFEAAARGVYGVFLNTDGFSIGEIAETYWGILLYQSCLKVHVGHVIYSGLDDAYALSGYDPSKYTIHFQGKSRVQAFIKAQPLGRTSWTITRTGPYIEMLSSAMMPHKDENGVYKFIYPLEDGAIVFIHLEDYGRYIHWIFENPVRSIGLDLGIGIAHITGEELATAFTAVTGKPAAYVSVPAETWCQMAFGKFPDGPNTKLGFRSTTDPSTLTLSYGENFTNFYNLWKASKGNTGLIKRDYAILDHILPDRVRSARDWMERTKYTAEYNPLLKDF